ncbi:MAG: hypothetical protein PHX44_01715 [Sulfurimonas sp.]|uniref:hypothetical protein n=1 Tax=Sulfurimonas sp. TaxID=2022749 RepID=UPI00260BC362|nr:hypothetical protein [Sulfurimonas sp.]MDD2651735.1 hypothetical protein [Sulfurimonas sp.]MDD2651752.1 hypothetical protein [Sulfurimonas sp.]MDD3451696.1 hypothetical protein [Sulfurimonas sp.]MDD3451713.1 hypothetical protein [Sulfurimonas sp.]
MQDLINFVDGGSKVKYYVDNVTYYPKPLNTVDFFEHEFKQFYKTPFGCFVGVSISQFVRAISVREFDIMKNDYLKNKNSSDKLMVRNQLLFSF